MLKYDTVTYVPWSYLILTQSSGSAAIRILGTAGLSQMQAAALTWPLAGMRLRPALFTSSTHGSCTVINWATSMQTPSFPLQTEQSQQLGLRGKPQWTHPDVFGCSSICLPTADCRLSSSLFRLICCLPLLWVWDKQMLPPC